jgi:hypothetical protein
MEKSNDASEIEPTTFLLCAEVKLYEIIGNLFLTNILRRIRGDVLTAMALLSASTVKLV